MCIWLSVSSQDTLDDKIYFLCFEQNIKFYAHVIAIIILSYTINMHNHAYACASTTVKEELHSCLHNTTSKELFYN